MKFTSKRSLNLSFSRRTRPMFGVLFQTANVCKHFTMYIYPNNFDPSMIDLDTKTLNRALAANYYWQARQRYRRFFNTKEKRVNNRFRKLDFCSVYLF